MTFKTGQLWKTRTGGVVKIIGVEVNEDGSPSSSRSPVLGYYCEGNDWGVQETWTLSCIRSCDLITLIDDPIEDSLDFFRRVMGGKCD